jgi:hypothetical protein
MAGLGVVLRLGSQSLLQAHDVGWPQGLRRERGALQNGAGATGRARSEIAKSSPWPLLGVAWLCSDGLSACLGIVSILAGIGQAPAFASSACFSPAMLGPPLPGDSTRVTCADASLDPA